MKVSFLALAICFSIKVFAQQRDTVFLKREIADTPYRFYHAIFIDSSSGQRDELTNFDFSRLDSTTYFAGLASLKRSKKVKATLENILPKKWIALHKLNGTYYLYRPSDMGSHFRFEITDSTTIDFMMDGPQVSRIIDIHFYSQNKTIIDRANPWNDKQVQLQIIDTTRGIAVFTFGPGNNGYQRLMVDVSKAHLFPIIVNYCPAGKQMEFDFDEIDFEALIK